MRYSIYIKIIIFFLIFAVFSSSVLLFYSNKNRNEFIELTSKDFSVQDVDNLVREIWVRETVLVLCILIFFVLGLLIILSRFLKPLKQIAFACRQMKKGNLNITLPVDKKTEIGELSETFNETIKSLKNFNFYLNQARLRTEEEKNRSIDIINNFADGLLVFDKENHLSLINPQAKEFLNVESEEVVGKHISKLSGFGYFGELIQSLKKEQKEIFREELVLSPNLILEISSIFIVRARIKQGMLVILHNITREKKIEEMKTEFVSLAAHQLRTPLSAIKWTIKMMMDGDLGPLTEKQKNFLNRTYCSNERMINLINDLLSVARIEEGRYMFKVLSFDLEEMVVSSLNSLEERFLTKDIKLVFNKPQTKLPQTIGDKEKIGLAIQNLIENALRYTPSGGEVTVSLKNATMGIELCIKDTGIGIPSNQLHRVFSKFFRADNVTKVDTEGTGLGLYLTKNIIEAHKGRIWFETKEGEGSTFCFNLPV